MLMYKSWLAHVSPLHHFLRLTFNQSQTKPDCAPKTVINCYILLSQSETADPVMELYQY